MIVRFHDIPQPPRTGLGEGAYAAELRTNGLGTIGSAILGVAGGVIGGIGSGTGAAVDWVGSLF